MGCGWTKRRAVILRGFDRRKRMVLSFECEIERRRRIWSEETWILVMKRGEWRVWSEQWRWDWVDHVWRKEGGDEEQWWECQRDPHVMPLLPLKLFGLWIVIIAYTVKCPFHPLFSKDGPLCGLLPGSTTLGLRFVNNLFRPNNMQSTSISRKLQFIWSL